MGDVESAVPPPDEAASDPGETPGEAGAEGRVTDLLDSALSRVDGLAATIERLTEVLHSDQDVIGRMQSRIETLQGDQVRALLGPAVTELANLHAAFAESAERDYERLGFDRVRKEFALLGDRIESAIDLLGAESVGASVGAPFDSRMHQAVKQVATPHASLDKTIAGVMRQGFTFDFDGKPALYARVSVYSFDGVGEPVIESALETSQSSPDAASLPDDELELPYTLDPQ